MTDHVTLLDTSGSNLRSRYTSGPSDGCVTTSPQGRQDHPFLPSPKRTAAIRYTNAWVDDGSGYIYLGDDKGRVHSFDSELKLITSSQPTAHGVAVFGMCGNDRELFTRDMAGNLVRWCRRSLAPLEFVSTQHFAAKDNPPAPSPSNAIEIVEDELWVCNARGSVSVFAIAETLRFVREVHRTPPAFSERLQAQSDGSMILCDVSGRVWRTPPSRADFEKLFEVGAGVVHSIAADPLHSRLWMTSDICGSVILIDETGALLEQVRITGDDVEELVFSKSGRECYVACFDHYIHVLTNDLVPTVSRTIGPFKFQLSHLKLAGENLLAILESGEAYLVNGLDGGVIASVGGTDCIWNVDLRGRHLLCPTESGRLASFDLSFCADIDAMEVKCAGYTHDLGYGRIRKAIRLDDDSILVATTSGCLARLLPDGRALWEHELHGILRDISVDPSQTYVVGCTERGLIVEVRITDGFETGRYINARPVWCILHRGTRVVLFGERRMVDDIRTLKADMARLASYNFATSGEETLLRAKGNFKRLMNAGTKVLVASNTEHYVFIFDVEGKTIDASFKEWIINTPENACIVNDKLYVVTYSQQIMQFDLQTGAVEDVQFSAEGYPKVICSLDDKPDTLLVAGRNFLSQYSVGQAGPELVRTFYLDGLLAHVNTSDLLTKGRAL